MHPLRISTQIVLFAILKKHHLSSLKQCFQEFKNALCENHIVLRLKY